MDVSLSRLNLGVEAWVPIKGGWEDHESGAFKRHFIGYAKLDSTWGIALRITEGNENYPEGENTDSWLFNDAPRGLRVDAIENLPDLLDRLTKKAESTAKKIAGKTELARELSIAMQHAAKDAAGPKKK